ncbi:MAG: hypothetical protein U0325_27600 [Polyangiales bacterium]
MDPILARSVDPHRAARVGRCGPKGEVGLPRFLRSTFRVSYPFVLRQVVDPERPR